MHLDRTRDLPLLAIEVAEDEVDLERVPVYSRRGGQFFDRQVELGGGQEVEPKDVE